MQKNKDLFDPDSINIYLTSPNPGNLSAKIPSYAKNDNEETWNNLGKYKMVDKYAHQVPAGMPSNPTHYNRPNSEENNPNFNPDMAQWESDQAQIKNLDKELTKFQRAKVFIESDLCRIKIAPSSMGVSSTILTVF
jgi:hypothetical protein